MNEDLAKKPDRDKISIEELDKESPGFSDRDDLEEEALGEEGGISAAAAGANGRAI